VKLTVPTVGKPDRKGIVYVLELVLEDKHLVKVGFTSRRKVELRVCEILTSVWKRYRIFPQCYVKRFKTVTNPSKFEAAMHKQLADYRYTTEHKFSGSTELFDTSLDTVVELYDKMVTEST